MERLAVGPLSTYCPIEAAIHVGRYAPLLVAAKGRRILDVACGEGYGSWILKNSGAARVDGVDVSPEAIGVANRLFASDGVNFHCGDWAQILGVMSDGSFDLIISVETIEHLPDPEAFLKEIRRLAAPGCVIYMTCPNDYWYYADGSCNPYHLRKYRFDEFKQMASSVLGDASSWMMGSPVQGFASIPIERHAGQHASLYVNVESLGATFLCLPGKESAPSLSNCSYYVGVWNCDAAFRGGAVFATSMDAFVAKEKGAENYKRLEESYRNLHNLWRAASTQATVLLHETSVLSASLADASARLDTRENELQRVAEQHANELRRVADENQRLQWLGNLGEHSKKRSLLKFVKRQVLVLKIKRFFLYPSQKARRRYRVKIREWRALRSQIRASFN
jgi:ubiquinone/menaquinone biosynthesis C-methylase UbiE